MAEPESVCRPSDMDLSLGLKLHRQADGDIIVTIGNASGRHMGCPDVEICTPGAGGSKSPETWRALGRLFEAMQADAEGRSLSPALPPGAIVLRDTEETRERIARSLWDGEGYSEPWGEAAKNSHPVTYRCVLRDTDAVLAALRESRL